MKAEIQSLAQAWCAAFNGRRIDDLVGFYTSQARILPPGRPALVSEADLRRYFNGVIGQGFRDYRIQIDALLTRDGMSVATGRWSIVGPGPDGFERRYEGNWLIGLLDSEPGKIAIQMWN